MDKEFEYEFAEENHSAYEKPLNSDQDRLRKIEHTKSECFKRIAHKIERLATCGHFSASDAISFIRRIENTFSLYGFSKIEEKIDRLVHLSSLRKEIRNLIGQVLYGAKEQEAVPKKSV